MDQLGDLTFQRMPSKRLIAEYGKAHTRSYSTDHSLTPSKKSVGYRKRTSSCAPAFREYIHSSDEEDLKAGRHKLRHKKSDAASIVSTTSTVKPIKPASKYENTTYTLGTTEKAPSFHYRYGRKYIVDSPYILPCDLQEIHRQNMFTMMTTTALGGPLCTPIDATQPPQLILDLGCGNGFWSSMCHDFFSCLKLPPAHFIGLDLLPPSMDLRSLGVNWSFVQHDLRSGYLPFGDDTFDLVVLKDMFMAIRGDEWARLVLELQRVLKPGGSLEIRCMDSQFRCLTSVQPSAAYRDAHQEFMARESGGYLIDGKTVFSRSDNEHIEVLNKMLHRVMSRRDLAHLPLQDLSEGSRWRGFEHTDVKRVAVPFSLSLDLESSGPPSRRGILTPGQATLRVTAGQALLDLVDSLEPFLQRTCQKNDEEWRAWWNGLAADVIENGAFFAGECMEVGAWWGIKSRTAG